MLTGHEQNILQEELKRLQKSEREAWMLVERWQAYAEYLKKELAKRDNSG